MRRIVMIFVYCLLCFNICACLNNNHSERYTKEVKDETVIADLSVEAHTIVAKYQSKGGIPAPPYLDAIIKFPQISDLKGKTIHENVNVLLKDVATQSLNNRNFDETLSLFENIKSGALNDVWGGKNEYTVIYAGNEFVSLNYKGQCYFGGSYPFQFSDYVTINLGTGKLVPFTDYFSKDDVIRAIKVLEFEWIEGQYTGGYTGEEPEAVVEFVEAIKQLKTMDDMSNTYNSASIYNFALDEEFAYIGMPFYDSLDGYVVLKFNLDALKNDCLSS